MVDVLFKSMTFVLIICIAYVFKRMHILKREDAFILSTIVMNVTLPCALLSSTSHIELNGEMFQLLLIGFMANVIMIILGYGLSYKENGYIKGTYMLNMASYNIGNFALPFAQTFFGGQLIAYLCAFDIGNAIMCLGTTYAIADHIASGKSHFSIRDLFKKLFSSVPFDIYVLIFICSLIHVTIPQRIIDIASTIGSGNAFLAMFMIGLMLEIKISKEEMKHVFSIVFLRNIGAIIMSLFIYIVVPLPTAAKQIVTLGLFAPISNISTVFTEKIGYKGNISATANSLSILVSIVFMTALLMIYA